MQLQKQKIQRLMAWLGLIVTVLTVVLRVWLLPTLRDTDTGLFGSGVGVVVLLVLALAVFAGMTLLTRSEWRLPSPGAGLWMAKVSLLSGGLLLICNLWDVWNYFSNQKVPVPEPGSVTAMATVLMFLQMACGILAGVALVRFGLTVVVRGMVRPGTVGWSMLAPVLWMWFRLARYEMSYVSAVRLSQGFFDVLMFVSELLFLFYLGRFIAGVGKPAVGLLRFFSASAAVFALSAPLVRLCLYFVGDSEAFLASQLPGLSDAAVGLLALVTLFALSEDSSAEDDFFSFEGEEETDDGEESVSDDEDEDAFAAESEE